MPELATRFDVSQVATLPDAALALASEEFDCMLVTGPLADSSPLETLEVLHGADPQTPVVFFDPEMTAAQAVQLIRNGA